MQTSLVESPVMIEIKNFDMEVEAHYHISNIIPFFSLSFRSVNKPFNLFLQVELYGDVSCLHGPKENAIFICNHQCTGKVLFLAAHKPKNKGFGIKF